MSLEGIQLKTSRNIKHSMRTHVQTHGTAMAADRLHVGISTRVATKNIDTVPAIYVSNSAVAKF